MVYSLDRCARERQVHFESGFLRKRLKENVAIKSELLSSLNTAVFEMRMWGNLKGNVWLNLLLFIVIVFFAWRHKQNNSESVVLSELISGHRFMWNPWADLRMAYVVRHVEIKKESRRVKWAPHRPCHGPLRVLGHLLKWRHITVQSLSVLMESCERPRDESCQIHLTWDQNWKCESTDFYKMSMLVLV